MMDSTGTDLLTRTISSIVRKDVVTIHEDSTVQQALDAIRSLGLGERIVYYYVLDSEERLTGVVPTRRLLTEPLEKRISEVMDPKVIALPCSTTLYEAHEIFVKNKYLALPVKDEQGRLLGVIDVGMFMDKGFDAYEREQVESVFETIGFRIWQVQAASPFRAFLYRFPWLLATITSGTACAVMVSFFDVTLEKSIVLAFFMTLALGLGESVSMQSMALTIQALHSMRPTMSWYLRTFKREAGISIMLGAGCSVIVTLVVWIWRGKALAAFSIGCSLVLVIIAGCVLGLTVPSLLHALRLDPKIAAGPATLALADISTILIYFGIATLIL